jgi:hypothetical protein
MNNGFKKIFRRVIVGLFLFCFGFCAGHLFDRIRNAGNPRGAAADVGGYDSAAQRVERAVAAVGDATGKAREASGEIRISIGDVGNIGIIAEDIGSGVVRALDGLGDFEDGIQSIMGILDKAEKRNTKMETAYSSRMD